MKPLHYIILALLLIYLISGIIFSYVSLQYRKNFRRIRASANILIRDMNEDLAKMKSTFEKFKVDFDYQVCVFAPDHDDDINIHRAEIYQAIDKSREQAKKLLDLVEDKKENERLNNIMLNVDNNMSNYRRLVLKHNKIVENYNFNAQSIVFVVFANMIGLSREEHI